MCSMSVMSTDMFVRLKAHLLPTKFYAAAAAARLQEGIKQLESEKC